MTVAWREFQRGTALIRRARDYGRTHRGATAEDTLNALGEPATEYNSLYARAGLFQAEQERKRPAREGLIQTPLTEATEEGEQHDGYRSRPAGVVQERLSVAHAYVEAAHVTDGAGVALRDSKGLQLT